MKNNEIILLIDHGKITELNNNYINSISKRKNNVHILDKFFSSDIKVTGLTASDIRDALNLIIKHNSNIINEYYNKILDAKSITDLNILYREMVKDYLSYTCYNNNRKSIKLLDALKEDNYSTLTNFVRLVFSKYYNNKLNNIYNIYKYASIDINKELIPKLSKEFTQDNKDNNLDKLAFEVVSRHIKNEMDGKHLCGACALDTFMSCPKVQKFNMPFDIYTFLTGIVVLKPYNKDKKLYEYDDGILIPKDSINYNIINYKGNKMCIDEFRVLDCDRHKEIKEEHKNNDLYEDDNNENKEGARKIISSEKYIHNDDVKKENNDKPVARIKFIPAGRHNK